MSDAQTKVLEELRTILGADPKQTTRERAKQLVDEVQEYRDGLAGGFGVVTATSQKTLVELGQQMRDHHRAHHQRERVAWQTVKALAIEGGHRASERAADQALAQLDEQGDPT